MFLPKATIQDLVYLRDSLGGPLLHHRENFGDLGLSQPRDDLLGCKSGLSASILAKSAVSCCKFPDNSGQLCGSTLVVGNDPLEIQLLSRSFCDGELNLIASGNESSVVLPACLKYYYAGQGPLVSDKVSFSDKKSIIDDTDE